MHLKMKTTADMTSEFKPLLTGGNMGPAHRGLGEIDGLLVPPGKASNLLTDHLITG